MKQLRLTKSQLLAAVTVLVSRLGVLPANISPLGSFGFFGHPLLYVATILIFDFGFRGIYPGFLFTYAGFACYPVIGWLTRKHLKLQLIGLPSASFLFFLLSNFGVWWFWYDHTMSQLGLVYSLALPFYVRTLLSDITFGYGYLLFKHRALSHLTKQVSLRVT